MFVCIPAASTPGKVWACRVREYTHAMVHIEFLDTPHNTTMHTQYFDEGAAAHVCMYYRHTHRMNVTVPSALRMVWGF